MCTKPYVYVYLRTSAFVYIYMVSPFALKTKYGQLLSAGCSTSTSVESQSLRMCFPLELIKMLHAPLPQSLQNRNFGDQKCLDIFLLPDEMRRRIWKAVRVLRSELGLIFLLFMIGLELNVEELVHLGQAGWILWPSVKLLVIAAKIGDITDITSKNGDSTSKHGDVINVIPLVG